MPNNFSSGYGKKFLEGFVPALTSDFVMAKTVTRDKKLIDFNSGRKSGNKVYVERPYDFIAHRTPTGDISSVARNSAEAGQAFATVQDYITTELEWTQFEQALEMNNMEEIQKRLAKRIRTDLETSLIDFMIRHSALYRGAAGTKISKWSDVASCFSYLEELGVTEGSNYAAVSPFAVQNLADAQSGLNNDMLVADAWKNAVIPKDFGGGLAIKSNALKSRTVGAYGASTLVLASTPAATYSAAKDTYQQTLTLSGAAVSVTGILKAGDILQIDDNDRFKLNQDTREVVFDEDGNEIKWTAVVDADVDSDGSGNVTVVVNGPAIFGATDQYKTVSSALTSGDSVVVKSGASGATVKPNLFFNEFAFGLSFVDLPPLNSTDSQVINVDGMSIRITKYSAEDENVQKVRLDLLPAFASFNPLMAGQFWGTP